LPRHALHSAKLEIEDGEGWNSRLPIDLRTFAGDVDGESALRTPLSS
jgi:hypothetical protein